MRLAVLTLNQDDGAHHEHSEPCGHSFCDSCVREWLMRSPTCPTCRRPLTVQQLAPNMEKRRKIWSLRVKCSRAECKAVGEMGRDDSWRKTHELACDYAPLPCKFCKALTVRREIKQHQNERCMKRPVVCKYCKATTRADEEKEHSRVCLDYPIECPLRCRAQQQQQQHAHALDQKHSAHASHGVESKHNAHSAAAASPVAALAVSVARPTVAVAVGAAVAAVAAAPAPILTFPRRDLDKHLAVCPKEPVPCVYAHLGCTAKLPRGDQQTHEQDPKASAAHNRLLLAALMETKSELTALRLVCSHLCVLCVCFVLLCFCLRLCFSHDVLLLFLVV